MRRTRITYPNYGGRAAFRHELESRQPFDTTEEQIGLAAAATLRTLAITFAAVMLGVVVIQMGAAVFSMDEVMAAEDP